MKKASTAKSVSSASAEKTPSPAKEKTPRKSSATASSPKAENKKSSSVQSTTPAKSKNEGSAAGIRNAAFLAKQRQHLLTLKDKLLDSMRGVAKDTLRSRAEGSEGNAFGMHQADAGSDAYERDFSLSLLSQEQNLLYEIDEALKRIEDGTYGICEISNKPIPQARLEVLPFTRYTVECQEELEKQNRFRARVPVTSLFGLGEDEDTEDDDNATDTKD